MRAATYLTLGAVGLGLQVLLAPAGEIVIYPRQKPAQGESAWKTCPDALLDLSDMVLDLNAANAFLAQRIKGLEAQIAGSKATTAEKAKKPVAAPAKACVRKQVCVRRNAKRCTWLKWVCQ